jgi:hypothetical protein
MRISRHDLRRRYSNSLVIDAGSQFTLRACSQASNENAQDIFLQDPPEQHMIWKMQLLTPRLLKLVILVQISSLFDLLAGIHLLPYGRHLLSLLVFGHMVK